MNDTIADYLAYFLRRRDVQLGIGAVVVLIIAWVVIAILLQPPTLKVQSIGVTIASVIESKGANINVYNGNSFYTIDTANNNAMKVVYTPTYRLPTVSTMTWADNKGALLTFRGGIVNTPVYDYFTAHDIDTTSDSLYTWYLDFTTGELSIVGEFDIDGTSAFYSHKDRGFFFAPLDLSESIPTDNSLWYYDIGAKSSHVVIQDFDTTVKSIQQCDTEAGNVCITGYRFSDDYSTNRLIAVSKDSTNATTLHTLTGKIVPTPIRNMYVLLSGIDNSKQNSDDERFRMSTYYENIQTLNISTKETHNYDGIVYERSVAAGAKDNKLYLVDGETNEVVWLLGNGKITTIKADENQSIDEGITVIDNQLNPNVLVAGVDGDVYMLSEKSVTKPQFANPTRAADIIDECTNYYGGKATADGTTYTVLVEDNDNFNRAANSIKRCIASKPEVLLNYTYIYRGYSSVNGRISTD